MKMKLNVHKLSLKDAIDEILYKCDECKELGDSTLEIIHGHKHGTRIRDYIRSDGFTKELTNSGFIIAVGDISDPGATIFQFKSIQLASKLEKNSSSISAKSIKRDRKASNICVKCNVNMVLLKDLNWYKCSKCGKLIKPI